MTVLDKNSQLSADYELREQVRESLQKWGIVNFYGRAPLPLLLGLEPADTYAAGFNEDHRHICNALLGPYGKVVLKMLMIKRGLT